MMTSKIRTNAAEAAKRAPNNVYALPTIRRRARHNAIRAFLNGLIDRHNEHPAVAAASVFLREDGTVSISAKGVDPDTADEVLAGVHQLARRIEASKPHYQTPANRQRGGVSLLILAATGFSLASYLNATAWLDVVLVLAAQASALLLTKPPRR
ncbi:hypothetical protein [Burkholderia ubonensis]|uniref:hypothetical protein n=2 Tax=Burkholderia ubonensis TaxID=101571 RepID=UPI0012F9A705|nr:hypothetical protein [Burkholderia ubonensis]